MLIRTESLCSKLVKKMVKSEFAQKTAKRLITVKGAELLTEVGKKIAPLKAMSQISKQISPFGVIRKNMVAAGAVTSFVQTAFELRKSTEPGKALAIGIAQIAIDCMPPQVKYPAYCGGLLASILTNKVSLSITIY